MDTRAQPDGSHPPPPPLSAATAERLREVRLRLLDLHKALLEDSRTAYELDRGRIPTTATLLQLVINDPWFAWLRPLSETVVRIDVMLLPDAEATEADAVTLLEQVERLLSPAEGVEPFAAALFGSAAAPAGGDHGPRRRAPRPEAGEVTL